MNYKLKKIKYVLIKWKQHVKGDLGKVFNKCD